MIIDLFAGAGGWSEGLRLLSSNLVQSEIGIELDPIICQTREAATHHVVEADVSKLDPTNFKYVEGLIASPPCQDFSISGTHQKETGPSGWLVREPLRWAKKLYPNWIICEQVPPVLPIWNEIGAELSMLGYSVWTGMVNAADYGVPQVRKRAFLLASNKYLVSPPLPTHNKDESFFIHRWTAMEKYVSHNPSEWTLNTGQSWKKGTGRDNARKILLSQPSPTITQQARSWQWRHSDINLFAPVLLSQNEASIFQTFPIDYPFVGSKRKKFLQLGNAVPPLLAAHFIAAVSGHSLPQYLANAPKFYQPETFGNAHMLHQQS